MKANKGLRFRAKKIQRTLEYLSRSKSTLYFNKAFKKESFLQ